MHDNGGSWVMPSTTIPAHSHALPLPGHGGVYNPFARGGATNPFDRKGQPVNSAIGELVARGLTSHPFDRARPGHPFDRAFRVPGVHGPRAAHMGAFGHGPKHGSSMFHGSFAHALHDRVCAAPKPSHTAFPVSSAPSRYEAPNAPFVTSFNARQFLD